MNTNSRAEKPMQPEERFLWENEEEATGMEMESISYSALTLATGMMVTVVLTVLLIIF